MFEILKKIIHFIVSFLIKGKFFNLLAFLFTLSAKEILPSGEIVRFKKKQDKRITIFALNHEQFRDDHFVLAATKKFKVVINHPFWLFKFLWSFYNIIERNTFIQNIIEDHPLHGPPYLPAQLRKNQILYREFLLSFLPIIYKKMNIDCVISADARYFDDFDWGNISDKINTPYIVLHRECLVVSKYGYEHGKELYRKLKKFGGSLIIVHNLVAKKMFLDSKYVEEKNIKALGSLRMDGFIQKIEYQKNNKIKLNKQVVFFEFYINKEYIPNDFELYRKYFETACLLAIQNPDIKVIYKPKSNFFSYSKKTIKATFNKLGVDINGIKNLDILPNANVHDLIFNSRVICAFNSTVLLESAIACNDVIIPYFNEFSNQPHSKDETKFIDHFDLFQIAKTQNELIKLIKNKVENPSKLSDEILHKRRNLFNDYVSSIEGGATEKYIEAISFCVNQSQKNL